jgi:hypothetical protein
VLCRARHGEAGGLGPGRLQLPSELVHHIEVVEVRSRKATTARIDKAFDKAGLKFRIQADAFTMTAPLRILSKHGLGPARRK